MKTIKKIFLKHNVEATCVPLNLHQKTSKDIVLIVIFECLKTIHLPFKPAVRPKK